MLNSTITKTQKWLEDIIIGHNFCPFAKKEFVQSRIRFSLFEYKPIEEKAASSRFPSIRSSARAPLKTEQLFEQALTFLMKEVDILDNQSETETTLLIFDKHFSQFDEFLDIVDVANHFLEQSDYLGVYQLATFHPQYLFEGEAPTDASNYTNRSPYPMLHLLRESSIERVLEQYLDPEDIPHQNIKKARELGVEYFRTFLSSL